jgi:CRISPR/Cas system-associated endoribonuclease Cas2
MRTTLSQLQSDLKKVQRSSFRFGNNEENEEKKVKKELNDMSQKEKKGLKLYLLKFLKSAGYEVYNGMKFTLKEVIKMTIKYVGPMVLAALLFKYRKNVGSYIRPTPFPMPGEK